MTYRLDEELTRRILGEVLMERRRQVEQWGDQASLRSGTGKSQRLFGWDPHTLVVAARRRVYQRRDWFSILLEEVFEALEESDRAKLRAEVVQIAAVAVAWVEKLDRETGWQ